MQGAGGPVGGWEGGSPTAPPPPLLGVGHFWVPGFSETLGAWIPHFKPPPPPLWLSKPLTGARRKLH